MCRTRGRGAQQRPQDRAEHEEAARQRRVAQVKRRGVGKLLARDEYDVHPAGELLEVLPVDMAVMAFMCPEIEM